MRRMEEAYLRYVRKLCDIDANVLPCTAQTGWLTLYDTGSLSGSVDLQGRGNESGGVVTIIWDSGYTDSKTITAADGSWSFTGIPVGSYQVIIEMARYLDAYKSGVTVTGGGTALTKVKLLGGDANDDDSVGIDDAAIIGGVFGSSPPSNARADINNDNVVDILDLVLMGGNYAKVSPVTW